MKILVVGSGGREHAIVCALAAPGREIHCAPGNGGIAQVATCVDISATDIEGIKAYAMQEDMDLVFVAPDDPLYMGMVDELEMAGLRVFGPYKMAAKIEGSKIFAKGFMERNRIPTAKYAAFDSCYEAIQYVTEHFKVNGCIRREVPPPPPVVIKAEGLALGKGVIIAETLDAAIEALREIMEKRKFGSSGRRVVIEEFLEGREVTVLAFTDGKTIVTMPASQDHKRAYDGDEGPNTGGMGAFAPTPYYTTEIADYSMEYIIQPTVDALYHEGRKFKGVIYFGLIMTERGVKVIEYNARFGDPETQVVLPLLKTDLLEIVDAIIDERLHEVDVQWSDESAVCVVMASGGYPGDYEKGKEIEIGIVPDATRVYHSGTKEVSGKLVTNGGRVLVATGTADTLDDARGAAYRAVEKIKFDGMMYRKDIWSA